MPVGGVDEQVLLHAFADEFRRVDGQVQADHRAQDADLADQPATDPDADLLALDEAISRLATEDPLAAKVVELRQFAGLGHEDIAATLGITVYRARQKWTYARAWLCEALAGPGVQAAVDRAIVRGDARLCATAEVAFLPPMSGG